MIVKRFETYVSIGNLCLSQGSSLFLEEVGFSPRKNHVFKEEFKLPWGIT
jgi:hypothetical protein